MNSLIANVLGATAYAALGWLGLHVLSLHPVVSGVWPAAGFAVALIFLGGRRLAPGILAGAFLVHAMEDVPLAGAALIAVGNTAAAIVGAWALTALRTTSSLARLRDVGALTVAAAGAALLSAVVGVGALVAMGLAESRDAALWIGIWWFGDALGVLIVTPLLLITGTGRWQSLRQRAPEVLILLAAVLALTIILFSNQLPYTYAVFPLTAIVAFRLGPAGAVLATLLVAAVATVSTALRSGPFAAFPPVHELLLLQLFIGLLALKGLLLGAATEELQAQAQEITHARETLASSRDQLTILSQRLLGAHDWERRTIARGLHDDVGQTLTAIKMGLEGLRGHLAGNGDTTSLPGLDAQVRNVEAVLGTVRDLSFELHPAILDDLGLAAAIRQHVDRLARRAGFQAHMDITLDQRRLPGPIESACFRVLQEALNNVVRHARATVVTVTVHEGPEDVEVMVRDDGVGFDTASVQTTRRSGIGLLTMRERTVLTGGSFDLRSRAGQGTTVVATFPVPVGGES
jgi:signal transduction histidine kinase